MLTPPPPTERLWLVITGIVNAGEQIHATIASRAFSTPLSSPSKPSLVSDPDGRLTGETSWRRGDGGRMTRVVCCVRQSGEEGHKKELSCPFQQERFLQDIAPRTAAGEEIEYEIAPWDQGKSGGSVDREGRSGCLPSWTASRRSGSTTMTA